MDRNESFEVLQTAQPTVLKAASLILPLEASHGDADSSYKAFQWLYSLQDRPRRRHVTVRDAVFVADAVFCRCILYERRGLVWDTGNIAGSGSNAAARRGVGKEEVFIRKSFKLNCGAMAPISQIQ